MQCTQCNGYRTIKSSETCSICNGYGYVEHSETCSNCSGYGTVSGGNCGSCGGSGSINGETCGTCGGSGKAADVTCGTCNGNRTVTVRESCPTTVEVDVTCPTCNGTGEIAEPAGGGGGAGGSAQGDVAIFNSLGTCGVVHEGCLNEVVILQGGELVKVSPRQSWCDCQVGTNQYGVKSHIGATHHCRRCGFNFGTA
jgi:RecJ-like exonuclease